MTKRQQQADETKRKIYRSATKMISQYGHKNTKISDICADANVSSGLFYHYYKSKVSIYQEGLGFFHDLLETTWDDEERGTSEEQMHYLIGMQLDHIGRNGHYYAAFFYEAPLMYEVLPALTNGFFYRKLLEVIEMQVSEDKLSGDADEIFETLVLAVRGTIYDWACHQGMYDLREKGFRMMNIVLSHYGGNK